MTIGIRRAVEQVVSIKGMNKPAVLTALFNAATPTPDASTEMNTRAARKLLEERQHFECLFGRVLKVDLSGDRFYAGLYDAQHGRRAAAKVINTLRKPKRASRSAS